MNTTNQKVLDILALMVACGVKKEDLPRLCDGLFDISYLNEREVLVRMSTMTNMFDLINKL